MNNYQLIITLNVNGLNAPIKRNRIGEWIRKHDPQICCLQETHLRTEDLHRQKVKGWKQIFQANGQEKKSRSSNTHIRQNRLQKKGRKERPRRSLHNTRRKNPQRRHKHCKYIYSGFSSDRINLSPFNIVNIYAPNIGAPKYIRKILEDFKKNIDSNTITAGDLNTPLLKMDRSSKQNYQQRYRGTEQCPRSNGLN